MDYPSLGILTHQWDKIWNSQKDMDIAKVRIKFRDFINFVTFGYFKKVFKILCILTAISVLKHTFNPFGHNEIGSFEWTVRVTGIKFGKLPFACSGTLISNRHILTAQHCANGNRSGFKVEFYNSRLLRGQQFYSRKVYFPSEEVNKKFELEKNLYIQRSPWNPYALDIAILEIDPVNITPINLPKSHDEIDYHTNQISIANGFGKHADGCFSCLREYEVKIKDGKTCYKEFLHLRSPKLFLIEIPQRFPSICTSQHKVLKGDSGGPIMQRLKNEWVIVGVASHEYSIYDGFTRTVIDYYVSVTELLPWIHDVINNGTDIGNTSIVKILDVDADKTSGKFFASCVLICIYLRWFIMAITCHKRLYLIKTLPLRIQRPAIKCLKFLAKIFMIPNLNVFKAYLSFIFDGNCH